MKPDDVKRLQRLGPQSLEHLPPYAFDAAVQAILKVKQLEESRLLREGLYYIALTDLSGATASSARLGKDQNKDRIQEFVEATIWALVDTAITNTAMFVKDVGDGALFLFAAFTDVLDWHAQLMQQFDRLNSAYGGYKDPDPWTVRAKTVVHLGEVTFSDDRDPAAQSVNQIFKIEKNFGPNQLGCTDSVRLAGAPVLRERSIKPQPAGKQILPGDTEPTRLWLLIE